jgi:hypothetical protein
MVNDAFNSLLDLDPQYQTCPKCGVVEPCLVHQPFPADASMLTHMTIPAGVPTVTFGNSAPSVVAPVANTNPTSPVSSEILDMEDDFEEARQSIKSAMVTGRNATEKALELAESGDSPRAYEVVGKLIEASVNASKSLLDIHAAKKEIKAPTAGTPGIPGTVNIIDKAVFVGRASDLIRELAAAKKKELPAAPVEDK